jgi:hypothetical protein
MRYNLFVVYLLIGEQSRAVNLVKSLGKFREMYDIGRFIEKVEGEIFEMDECL